MLHDLRQIAHSGEAISAPQPHEATIHLPLPLPPLLCYIPLGCPDHLAHFRRMQIDRGVILILATLVSRKLIGHDRLHFHKMHRATLFPILPGDNIKFTRLLGYIAVYNSHPSPPQILGGNLLA